MARFEPLRRQSDHFLSREEWEEIDCRAEERWRVPAVPGRIRPGLCRVMAMCWWLVSTEAQFSALLRMPREVLYDPRLRLLPRAWVWVERWLKRLRKTGIDRLPDLPLFSSFTFGPNLPSRRWPDRLSPKHGAMLMRHLADRVNSGRLCPTVLYTVRPAYKGHDRVGMPDRVRKIRR